MNVTIVMGWWLVPLLIGVVCIAVGIALGRDELDDPALADAVYYFRQTALLAISGWAWAFWGMVEHIL